MAAGKLPGSNSPAVPFGYPDTGLAGISPQTAGVPGRIPGTYGHGAGNDERAPAVPFASEPIESQEPLSGTFAPVSSPGWGGRLKP